MRYNSLRALCASPLATTFTCSAQRVSIWKMTETLNDRHRLLLECHFSIHSQRDRIHLGKWEKSISLLCRNGKMTLAHVSLSIHRVFISHSSWAWFIHSSHSFCALNMFSSTMKCSSNPRSFNGMASHLLTILVRPFISPFHAIMNAKIADINKICIDFGRVTQISLARIARKMLFPFRVVRLVTVWSNNKWHHKMSWKMCDDLFWWSLVLVIQKRKRGK